MPLGSDRGGHGPCALTAFAALAAIATGVLACNPTTVIRVVDGRELHGRFVSDRAYALYARGAEAEAGGNLEDARVQYLAASDEDESNAEIWTRIGAVSCRLGKADDARHAFERAIDHAPDYEPIYRERAACALDHASITPAAARAAFEDATQALALDPDSEETDLLYARAAEVAGETAWAERTIRELCVRSPGRVAGWRALRDFGLRHDDPAAAARATVTLAALGAAAPSDALGAATNGPAARSTALDDVDAAIDRDALDEARSAAKKARLGPADLAVRAAALGRAKLAKAQAELVFRADPSNASAAIALAVASDLLRDDAGVTAALADPAALTTPPSPLARLLFAELIERRTDRAAARLYLGPLEAPPADADALLRTVAARVAKSLQK